MAFQPGNKHGEKGKLFDQALRRAIAQDDGKRLRAAAEKILDMAAEGEPWAVKELADRLDGKSHQSSQVTVNRGTVRDLPDSELANIAAGGSEGVVGAEGGAQIPSVVH